MNTILPTTLVGSYPQPDWLIDRAKLAGRFPPRVRAKELWRVAPEWLEQAQDDATLLAIRDQERAGLDIITDGEMRRDRDVRFLRANTNRMIKITVPGPFTMAQQAQNDFYKDEIELAMAYATAVNEEIKDLFAAGADVVQVDEPYLQARPAKAKQWRTGIEPRAKRYHWYDCRSYMFRLRSDYSPKTVGLFVSARAQSGQRAADFDRNRAVPPRL
jgi:5-methyltetrahydropteroyltriglutamate--homocysteine methyltransferase